MSEELKKIKGVGKLTVETLLDAGLDTIEKVAEATPEGLVGIPEFRAEEIIESAKSLVAVPPPPALIVEVAPKPTYSFSEEDGLYHCEVCGARAYVDEEDMKKHVEEHEEVG